MNLPLTWLSEFTGDILEGRSVKEYCDRMTDTGSKVEGWETLGADIENVVVGKILSIEKHPDSDHLLICRVDCGEEEPRQIVTGAQNVFEGAIVPVAKAPAKLPGGVVIKSGKLRGVLSDGMLCSIAELGLTLHDMPEAVEDGILILRDTIDCTVGQDIRDALLLLDTVVEFEITPNRPDCLSVIGLARETGASFDIPVRYHTPVVKGAGGSIADYINVEVAAPELCPRYTARVVRNVKIEPSPLWMRLRLRAAGVRPINNIVDITNYVMLEYGQPMHAFDYACIDGRRIVVRCAEENEAFRSLDDKDHVLKAGMLVIADEKKAVGLAGIMGGANSEIKDETATVVFESANFLGSSIRLTSRALGMRTESSGRFEKGLDAEMTLAAVERACELVELLGAGEVVDGIVDVYRNKRPQTFLKLDAARINTFLGVQLEEGYMADVLRKLDFEVRGNVILVPSFRADVECMNDIAEEIIRIYGYNAIEATPFIARIKTGEFTPRQGYKQRLCDLLCTLGLYEACTFSFISSKHYDKINLPADDPMRNSLRISNPLGEDTSVMRTTILPSVLEALARNNNFGAENAGLFETAAVYLPAEDGGALPAEPLQTAMCFYGGDFYRLKGICETVFEDAGIKNVLYTALKTNSTYHPGRCASACAEDGAQLAVLGELHPAVAANYGFDQPVYAAVLDTEGIFTHSSFQKQYHPLPKYPAMTRDFSFLCDDALEAGTVEAVMKEAGGKLLEEIKLFDVYRGAQLPEGMKSMAFSIALRAADRTLTDEEADKAASKILSAVEQKLGITLRA